MFESQTWMVKPYTQVVKNLERAFATFDELPGHNKNISFRLGVDTDKEMSPSRNVHHDTRRQFMMEEFDPRYYQVSSSVAIEWTERCSLKVWLHRLKMPYI